MEGFARLSTGTKMLIILSTALLPLGLIALFASIDSAKNNRFQREGEARILAVSSARQIDAAVVKATTALRYALNRPDAAASCQVAAMLLSPSERRDIRIARFSADRKRRCATAGFSTLATDAPRRRIGTELWLVDQPPMLRVVVGDRQGRGDFGVADLPLRALASIAQPAAATTPYKAALTQGTARIEIFTSGRKGPLDQQVSATAPIGGGQVAVEMMVSATPITGIEVLMVLLPILMWAAAAIIGWVIVDRLLLRPLSQLQRAIGSYRAGAGPLVIPRVSTPATEIKTLGESFRNATAAISGHEAELEAGLRRQTSLTREVHHRVKNNLQVISSLINIHARGAVSPAVAEAYASIQRRVDALAVVHRNHYAELEENRGVSLRALVGELASNLRATAPPAAHGLVITLNMMPAFASQDVAAPVAFLITELVELVMICDPASHVAILLQPGSQPNRALLAIEAPTLASDACHAHPSTERFNRIVEGLARQLRTRLQRDDRTGRYEIEITIMGSD